MEWIEINRKDNSIFPENPNFDHKTFYKFTNKYGYTHYSDGPERSSMKEFLQTKKDDGRTAQEKGFPPYYEHSLFLKGPKRHVLLAFQPYRMKEEIEDDLDEWNDGTYDIKVYDKSQSWFDPSQERMCIVLIILKTINFKEAQRSIDQIIGTPGKPPKRPLSADAIIEHLDRLGTIEGMNAKTRGTIISSVETAKKQIDNGELSAPMLRNVQRMIMDPANYDKDV